MKVLRFLYVLLFAALLAAAVRIKEVQDLDRAAKAYRAETHLVTFSTAHEINRRFQSVYQTVRALTSLPALRNLKRSSLTAETQEAINGIFRSVAESQGLSEIDIVTLDFAPDQALSKTSRPLLIVSHAHPSSVESTVETQQFALLKTQLDALQRDHAVATDSDIQSPPAYLGPEVIVRDSSQYSTEDDDDRNRSGIVYSLPIYDHEKHLVGMVSAVLLSNSLRELLRDGYYAIHSAKHLYVTGRQQGTVWLRVLPFIEAEQPDPSLMYSEVQPLEVNDSQGNWTLWSWLPDVFFWQREDVRAAKNSALVAYLSIGLLTLAGLVLTHILFKRRELLETMNQQLSDQVHLRTADLEQALAVAEHATRAKSQFLANMSHEIRTPMNGVIGMLDIVSNSGVDEKVSGFLEIARQSSQSLLRIIDDILDYSKIEAGKLSIESIEFDPIQITEDVAALLASKCHSKGLSLNCDTPTDMSHMVFGDPTRLRQVLINLLGNAIKFTEKGKIHLSLDIKPIGSQHVDLTFVVADTGIGMKREVLRRLFTAFTQADETTTRRFGGTGLGLSISQRLVELMGGKITAQSTEGQGSRFEFTLKAAIGKPMEAPNEILTPPPARCVLVVDDNLTDCMILKHHLDHWQLPNHAVHTAAAAIQALSAGLNGQPYDLVLLDMMLPDKDGLTLASEIDANPGTRHVVKVLLTSSSSVTQEQLLLHGIAAMHIKPARPRDIRKSLALTYTPPAMQQAMPASTEPSPATRTEGPRVLVVDDNEINQTVISLMLERLCAHVTQANNGKDALRLLGEGTFDIVLLDCHMPIMDGYETIKRLREMEQGTRMRQCVIALTASAMQEDRDRCAAAGMDDFLSKPVAMKELQRMMHKWLPGRFAAVA